MCARLSYYNVALWSVGLMVWDGYVCVRLSYYNVALWSVGLMVWDG